MSIASWSGDCDQSFDTELLTQRDHYRKKLSRIDMFSIYFFKFEILHVFFKF